MLLDQCAPGAAARAARLGINVMLNASCTAPRPLRSLGRRQLGVLPIANRPVQGTNLLGWAYPDEPDNNHWSPSKLAQTYAFRQGTPDGLLSFLTTTAAFYTAAATAKPGAAATTATFAALADVSGFDLYPLNHCRSTLVEVYDAQRRFARLARGKPTFQWIETGAIHPGYCGGITVTGQEVTAEAWLAVAGGARGIGFFTHTWAPDHSEFSVGPAVQQAIRGFSETAAVIRPGLTGTTTDSTVDTPALRVLARVGAGHTYVVAVNTLQSDVPAAITVPHVGTRTLRVVGSTRRVSASGGRFRDTFPPLGVRIYVTQ
jgi:hypothetical protein